MPSFSPSWGYPAWGVPCGGVPCGGVPYGGYPGQGGTLAGGSYLPAWGGTLPGGTLWGSTLARGGTLPGGYPGRGGPTSLPGGGQSYLCGVQAATELLCCELALYSLMPHGIMGNVAKHHGSLKKNYGMGTPPCGQTD